MYDNEGTYVVRTLGEVCLFLPCSLISSPHSFIALYYCSSRLLFLGTGKKEVLHVQVKGAEFSIELLLIFSYGLSGCVASTDGFWTRRSAA